MIFNFIKKTKLNSKPYKYRKLIFLNIFLLSFILNFSKKILCEDIDYKLITCSTVISLAGSFTGQYLSNTNHKYESNITGLASGLLLFKFYGYLYKKNQTKKDQLIKNFLESDSKTFGLMFSSTALTSYLTGLALE